MLRGDGVTTLVNGRFTSGVLSQTDGGTMKNVMLWAAGVAWVGALAVVNAFGDVVDPKIRKSALAKVNLHQMPGSHSIAQLNKTVKLRLSSTRENNQLKVSVEVSNVAAGHYVPTGSPLRQLVLEVQADPFNGAHFREERRYQRTVADRQGAVLVREHAAFFDGAKVLSDTRLAPDETRTELFAFPVPPGVAGLHTV